MRPMVILHCGYVGPHRSRDATNRKEVSQWQPWRITVPRPLSFQTVPTLLTHMRGCHDGVHREGQLGTSHIKQTRRLCIPPPKQTTKFNKTLWNNFKGRPEGMPPAITHLSTQRYWFWFLPATAIGIGITITPLVQKIKKNDGTVRQSMEIQVVVKEMTSTCWQS